MSRPLPQLFRLAPLLALLTVVLVSAGCFKRYTVISSSGPPSEVAAATELYVQFDYSHTAISKDRMSEEQWLETREKDEHRTTYLETKESVETGIVEGLQKQLGNSVALNRGQAPAGAMQLTYSFIWWEEGMYAAVVAWPSEATVRAIFSRDGATLDEIEVKAKEDATLYTPAPQQRFHTVGQRLGEWSATYITDVKG